MVRWYSCIHSQIMRKRHDNLKTLDYVWWSSWCTLDLEHEHSPRRQQKTLSKQWSNLNLNTTHDHDVLSLRLSSRLSRYRKSMRYGLHLTPSPRNISPILKLDINDPIKYPKYKDYYSKNQANALNLHLANN